MDHISERIISQAILEEQFKVARLTNSRQIQTSGMVKLLSERTLCDYTHYYQKCTRFSEEVDQMLANLSDWKRHVTLVLDEMKVKESIVYNKHQTKVIGLVNLGDTSDHLDQLERYW